MSESARTYWNGEAATFDDGVDHGLHDEAVRAAWRTLLLKNLPPPPAEVIDLGCGTGTLSVLLAEHGYSVSGLDLADEMVAAARQKSSRHRVEVDFRVGDASRPPYPAASCDVVLSRHVLWAMPDPAAALSRWARLLRPGGRLLLVEGSWSTGAGLRAAECERLLQDLGRPSTLLRLDDARYWGAEVADERYLLVSEA